jgi:hypothetical protein
MIATGQFEIRRFFLSHDIFTYFLILVFSTRLATIDDDFDPIQQSSRLTKITADSCWTVQQRANVNHYYYFIF